MLTWHEAYRTVIEFTEIGYTQKSCDRIWHIVSVEDGDPRGAVRDKIAESYKGNWIYLAEGFTSYDPMDETLCFLSWREAHKYLTKIPEEYRGYWHTVNLGDMLRHERRYLDYRDVGLNGEGFTPKFRGSDAAFALKREVGGP